MISLTPAERSALKARAHHLDPVVMIGDAGLSDAVLKEIDTALKSHELIKVRVLGDDRDARNGYAAAIGETLDAVTVQAIGKLLVLFRPGTPEEKKSSRPRKPSGPRRTKKQEAARAEKKRAS
jgi:putative YhbY family RNA-binding protein